MKLMKSFLTLLLLGGMTFAGCDKAKSGDEPAGETPSGETPSGETPSGSGDSTPSGGGDTTPPSGGGDTTPPSGGGDTTPPSGGGGDTDPPAVLDHFNDKKIVVESYKVEPAEADDPEEMDMTGAYAAFFSEDKTVEFVNIKETVHFVMLGTYSVNEAGTIATISINRQYSSSVHIIQKAEIEYQLVFNAELSKYTMDMVDSGVTVTYTAGVSEESPVHETIESIAYVLHSTDDEHWSKTDLIMEDTEGEPPFQFVAHATFAENEEFAIDLGALFGGWKHYENYPHDPNTAGGKVVEGKENEDHSHNLKVTEAGEYSIYVKSGVIYIVHDTTVTYSLWLKDSWVHDADVSAHPEYYVWTWTEEDEKQEEPKPGKWVAASATEFSATEIMVSVTVPNNVIGLKLLRCDPSDEAINVKPVVGATSYGDPSFWNETNNFILSRTGGDIDVNFKVS